MAGIEELKGNDMPKASIALDTRRVRRVKDEGEGEG